MKKLLFILGTFILFFLMGYYLQSRYPSAQLVSKQTHFKSLLNSSLNSFVSQEKKTDSASKSELDEILKEYAGRGVPSPSGVQEIDLDPTFLKTAEGRSLFEYLLSQNFKNQFTFKHFEIIQDRFMTPLPQENLGHVSLAQNELANRLGILKAMEEISIKKTSPSLKNSMNEFYLKFIQDKNSSLVFRRQAYRNFRKLQLNGNEKYFRSQIGAIDPQVIALAALSEREMFEAYFE